MGLEQLWSGWRYAYVVDVPKPDDIDPAVGACVFCRILGSDLDDAETYIVARGQSCFAILNAYPYTTAHLLVMPYAHVGSLGDLDAVASAELWSMIQTATATISSVYEPEGLNVGFNLGRAGGAGIPDHLHGHVLPRWAGDTNFMTSVANARVLPEALEDTWRRLSEAWPSGPDDQ